MSDLIVIYGNKVVYVHKEGANNKMKGETNAWLKHGDTLVKRGDTQDAVVGYSVYRLIIAVVVPKEVKK